jgi:hypothetical protein
MAYVISRWPVTTEAWVCAWVRSCGICHGQSGSGTGFPLLVSFHHASILVYYLGGGALCPLSSAVQGYSLIPLTWTTTTTITRAEFSLLVAIWLILVVEGKCKDRVRNVEHWLHTSLQCLSDLTTDLVQHILYWNISDQTSCYVIGLLFSSPTPPLITYKIAHYTHWIGGWLNFRAYLGMMARRVILVPAGARSIYLYS